MNWSWLGWWWYNLLSSVRLLLYNVATPIFDWNGLVDGKAMDDGLWRRLGKPCDLNSFLRLWLLVIKLWCCIEIYVISRLIGLVWCWIEMSWLWFVRCYLWCKCYNDGDNLTICLIMMWYVNVLTSHVWIIMKGKYSCNSYCAMMVIIV